MNNIISKNINIISENINPTTKKTNYPELIENIFEFNIPKGQKSTRLDVFLTNAIHNASRNKVQNAIEIGNVTVNGTIKKTSYKINPLDTIICKVLRLPPIELIPENIPLNIIYEDESLLIVNKSAGMCVHPGVGNRYGTLINALLYYFGFKESIPFNLIEEDEDLTGNDDDLTEENEILTDNFINFNNKFNSVISKNESSISKNESSIPNNESSISNNESSISKNESSIPKNDNLINIRPGLIHRIDKNTSGLLVIAKNSAVHNQISQQFAQKTTIREYQAIVWGRPKEDKGRIEANIGRSTKDRTSFAIMNKGGKPAITDFSVIERFNYNALIKFNLLTGRTHQIRVHAGSIGHKLFADERYGGDVILYGKENIKWKNAVTKLLNNHKRQMLHAKTLGFVHPITKKQMLFNSELPEDMKNVIETLRNFSKE